MMIYYTAEALLKHLSREYRERFSSLRCLFVRWMANQLLSASLGPTFKQEHGDLRCTQRMPPTSWASTLRLPKSSFPARLALGERDKLLKYNRRCTDDLYAWQRKAGHGPAFVLHDGPPYANGDLHIGHALNKILKDITCRFQVLEGRRVDFRPGWDCHGLPIELKALQSQQPTADGKSLDALQVRKLARKLAEKTVENQKAEFRKWAIMADWDNAWKTMDQGYELRQLEVFKSMVHKGQIYRQLKPVYWSPTTRTALAEAELEYKSDHRSTAAFVLFPLLNLMEKLAQMLPNSSVSVKLVIWTTTPWTIPANKAIAVHRRLEYVLIRSPQHGFLLVAKARLSELECWMQRTSEEAVIGTCMGEDLVGQTYCHPLFAESANPQPILHGDFVSADSGTGLVHVAPGHGMDDYKLCQEYGIEPFAPIDDKGRFTHEAMPGFPESLEGLDISAGGNRAVLDLLKQRSALLAVQDYKHKYPYDWRSKQPVVIRATWQWFADLSGIREAALRALDNVRFVPEGQGQGRRLSSFVSGRSEWCISRQRAWGVPIPALYRVENGEAVMTAETIGHVISVMRERGTDAWWADDPHEGSWILPSIKNQGPYIRGKETMDVWFDSGTSWKELGERSSEQKDALADVYLEGTDQHRGWFQSSLLTRVANQMSASNVTTHTAPFKTLVTHGFTLDSSGRKMSKSEGNVIAPEDISSGKLLPLKKAQKGNALVHEGFGPDALRLWVASCDSANDVQIGEAVAKAVNGNMAKLRVTFKLLLGLLDTHDPERTVSFDTLGIVDRMALVHIDRLLETAYVAYSSFEYHKAAAAIIAYINTDLSGLYIESIKDCLYASALDSNRRVHAQIVLWEIFKNLSRILYPITPLLIEECLDHLPSQLQSFHPVKSMHGDEAKIRERSVTGPWMDLGHHETSCLLALNAKVKALQELARNAKQMGSSLQSFVAIEIPRKAESQDQQARESLNRSAYALEELLVVSKVNVYDYNHEDLTILPMQNAAWSYTELCTLPVGLDEKLDVLVSVYAPAAAKCVRCWKYNVPKRKAKDGEDVCRRCLEVLESQDKSER